MFNNLPFAFFIVFFCMAFVAMFLSKHKFAVLFLLVSAFALRWFAAHLDPFLHDWDEKFHALVARNMMTDPFVPRLRPDNVYDTLAWCCTDIWLHKQPLFMWQMALSMKLFGVSEFTIRYPSLLMGAAMVPLVYRIGLLLTRDKAVAFCAGVFMSVSGYQLDLISGYKGMDHNDVAFGFYVLASFWAYAEYVNAISKRKRNWAILVGVLAGCAVLNKWLVGLLVFAAWGINLLTNLRKTQRQDLLQFVVALLVCITVFLPWQLYTFYRFPDRAAYEMRYNTRHLFEAVEAHAGSVWFYLKHLPDYFGGYMALLLIPGFVFLFIKPYMAKLKLLLMAAIMVPFVFFSFIAATKVESYFFVAAPFGFMVMAIGFIEGLRMLRLPATVITVAVIVPAFFVLDVPRLQAHHNPDDDLRKAKVRNAVIYKNLRKALPGDVKIVVNIPKFSDVEVMFYHPDIIAFSGCPSVDITDVWENKNLPIAAFKDHRDYPLAPHVRFYPYLTLINEEPGYIYHAP